jgi:CBS domain-containing protein
MATDAPITPAVSPASSQHVTVAEVMRPATTSVESRAHLAAAAYLMKRSGDSALVVMSDDERRPIAIVTDADVAQAVADGRNLEETRISDVEKGPPVEVGPDASVVDAARTMLLHRIHHLPVVDGDRLVGIIDMAAACGALLERAENSPS